MKNIFGLLIGFLFLACASKPSKETVSAPVDHFAGKEGCFLLYNMKTQSIEKVIGDENCQYQYPACSTFKVPLAVMAFDAGVLKNEKVVLEWDGKKDIRPELNKDHDARTWMRDSVVWFSQKIAPQLGPKKLQKYLDKFEYGNRDFSQGITTAWLVSPSSPGPALKISGYEQLEFMKKLWTDTLPASKKAQALARGITYLETSNNGFRLSGKTGSNFFDQDRKIHLGWFIAHIEKDGQAYLAITNFRDGIPTEEKGYGGPRAKELTKKILADQGLW